MKTTSKIAVIAVMGALALSCGGNSDLNDGESPVILTVEITLYDPEIAICGRNWDVDITSMTVTSDPKVRGYPTSPNQNVIINRWEITPYRTDGGTTASPRWVHDMTVNVPSGGSANLGNYRVYPWENLNDLPLSNLFPENGGVDPETGNTNIRQSLKLQMFGKTVSGHSVATVPIMIPFNFYCAK